MIKNDRQFIIAQKKLRELEVGVKNISKKYNSNKNQLSLLGQGYVEHITQLKSEINEYKKFKKSPLPRILRAHNSIEISHQLVRLRIARGITQSKLADIMGCKQADISRIEREEYKGYTINQLERIAKSLDANIEVNFIPANIN